MDYFGSDRAENMPMHLFFGAVRLDHSTAIRADITKQDYSVCPRHWYVDAHFRCESCGEIFLWSALEQREWFENYRFYVDSRATRCRPCRALKREALALKQKYDQSVSEARASRDVEKKKAVVALIDQLASMGEALAAKTIETKTLLLKQIRKAEPSPPPYDSPAAGSPSGEA